MKRLDEILSKRVVSATSVGPSDAAPADTDAAEDTCPICQGAGFVRRKRELDDPLFGRAEPCSCVVSEDGDARRSRLERLSNLGALTRLTFEALGERADPGLPDAIARAAAFAADPNGWLVLTGPSGAGKTSLAAAIANSRIDLGSPALYVVVPDLLDHLRASYDAPAEEGGFTGLFEQVKDAPFLVLDDIDAAAPTPWAKEKLFQVVNHRFAAELPTVLTTTEPPEALEARFATRLSDRRLCTIVRLGAAAAPVAYRQVGGMVLERLQEMDFRSFDVRLASHTPEERETVLSAARAAREFAAHPQGWLTLSGPHGVGKTHLAAAAANRALENGYPVFFAIVPDLLDHLRASFDPGRGESGYDELFEEVRTAPLLVLDDLGAQATSPWAAEKLYQIVNYRTLTGLPTIVTTSSTIEELARTHPRVVSRIGDARYGLVVRIFGPHYRLGHLPPAEGEPRGRSRPRR
jgi:DNA replication protein DnaC